MYPIVQKIRDSKSAINELINNKLTQRSRKIIKYGVIIFLIIAFIPEIYLVPYYFVVVRPAAEIGINQVLNQVQSINGTGEKIEAISNWEQQNFTNIYGIKPNLSLDFGFFLICGNGRYPIYINESDPQPIKIRATFSPFTNDPYWITYYHNGACGELSSLFNFIANRSGIESRIVTTIGEDHAWDEVKINDTWLYFDPTLVEIFQGNSKYQSKWFGEPKDFESPWGWNMSRVTVEATDDDLTSQYTQVVNISVFLTSSSQISISKYNPGTKNWIFLFSREISPTNNITVEEIQAWRIKPLQDSGIKLWKWERSRYQCIWKKNFSLIVRQMYQFT